MKRLCLGCTAMLLPVLTACTTLGSDFAAPSVEVPAAWRQGDTINVDLNLSGWWQAFGDETLNGLQVRARAANFDLKAAIARVDEVRAQVNVAGADRYPAINAVPSAERSRTSANSAQLIAGRPLVRDRLRAPVELSVTLDLWGATKRQIEASLAQLDGATVAREAVWLTISTDLAENYFKLRALDLEIAVLERTLALNDEALTVSGLRLREGIGTLVDLTRVQTELANIEAELIDTRRRRALLESAIAVLCGEPASLFRIAYDPRPLSEPPRIPAGLPSELLLRRPDVAEAEYTAARRSAEIGAAKAAFLPSVKLTGSAGFESIELKDLLTWGSRAWAFGPSVTLPLFSGGRNQANLRAAEARYEQAVAAYRQSAIDAFRDVENALVGIREHGERYVMLERAQASALTTARHFELRVKAGRSGFLDALEAYRSWLQAERAMADAAGQRQLAALQLIKALGGGWDSQ